LISFCSIYINKAVLIDDKVWISNLSDISKAITVRDAYTIFCTTSTKSSQLLNKTKIF